MDVALRGFYTEAAEKQKAACREVEVQFQAGRRKSNLTLEAQSRKGTRQDKAAVNPLAPLRLGVRLFLYKDEPEFQTEHLPAETANPSI
ncbi:MAG TPA: hypothetical protein VJ715_18045 [Pyrinomonadaceae bacterium]|nr:hypothetical protein [Pyrinomonadaceae bacterium]